VNDDDDDDDDDDGPMAHWQVNAMLDQARESSLLNSVNMRKVWIDLIKIADFTIITITLLSRISLDKRQCNYI
jgi:hypothetical protein